MNHLLTENINLLIASIIVDQLSKLGVKRFYIAPGLRNAPLMSAAQNHPEIECISGVDERSLSFRALAASKNQGVPSVLTCTSGSALANFFPAVIEASETQTPLIIISADRPQNLITAGDNQTINQRNFYSDYTREFYQAECPSDESNIEQLTKKIYSIFLSSTGENSGPAHINLPLEAPLDRTTKSFNRQMITHYHPQLPERKSTNDHYKSLSIELNEAIKKSRRTLYVVGDLQNFEVSTRRDDLIKLFKEKQSSVFFDISSGLKYSLSLEDGEVPTFDHPEVYQFFKEENIDLIIHIGGRLTSKHFYNFIKDTAPNYIQLTSLLRRRDPSERARIIRVKDPIELALRLDIQKSEINLDRLIQTSNLKRKIIEESDFCFPQISSRVIESIESGSTLFIGNSTTIRSFDSYTSSSFRTDLNTITNRGASGIEGGLAMALGIRDSLPSNQSIYAVMGDISWIHDLGTMAELSKSKSNITIVVANNSCGGIFSVLKLEGLEKISPLMETNQSLNIQAITKAFDIEYISTKNKEELKQALEKKTTTPKIIEAHINQQNDLIVYDKLKTLQL